MDAEIGDAPVAIKIDAEGYDDNVLSGAAALLSSRRPLALLVESLGGGSFGKTASESEDRLARLGFARCKYDPWRCSIEETTALGPYNHLFIRDLAFARARVASGRRFDIIGFGAI